MVIVANNIAGPATAMGGADPTITIPSVMVTLDDGNVLKANAPFNATVSDGTAACPIATPTSTTASSTTSTGTASRTA